jgi:predicted amidohydrolase
MVQPGKRPIVLATAQSVITPGIRANGAEIRRLMELARAQGADIVHFPEGAMSGYTKSQIKSWNDVDWNGLVAELEETAQLAASLGLWAVIGCAHRLTPPHRPHNSLYVISANGTLVTRYDKQWCSHTEITRFFTPGRELGVFEMAGWKFGCALCIEIQFPELFQAYGARDIDCLLFSSYSEDPMFGVQAQGLAASHNYWFSISVPCQVSHAMSSRLIGPSGEIQATCMPGASTLVVNTLDESAPEWRIALHHARPWRAQARQGDIYRALDVADARSDNKSQF